MRKNVIGIMTSQRQNTIFYSRAECRLLKLPIAPRYWMKLTGIFENEVFSNKQRDAQEQLQCP